MHILVIEDELALCETIVRSLRRSLFPIAHFSSPFPIFCLHHSAGELKSLLRTKT